MLYLYFVLLTGSVFLLVAGIVEQRRHYASLHTIPSRVLVNGIRGKSSITRLCAGALRGGDLITVAKTTGTAARFIHPDATEEPVYRKFGIANVVEQIGIVRRAATYRPDALVIECMAVMPALQEVNQSKLIRSTIGVLCNVREDHLAEMGPTLDDVARSLCRSMPEDGICVTAEKERFHILQEEADARNCQLVYADPETVSDEELRGFSWFTFKENVAIALVVADLLGVEREVALQGMYDAPPDPGVLSVERYVAPDGNRLAFANVFAANDPESTLMNINQLLDLGAIRRPLNVVINCRPDRVERNGQMGEIIPDLQPDNVFVIGHPAKSAIDAIPAEWQDRAVDLGGEKRSADEFMPAMLGRMSDGASLVAIGNIHGQGEELLEYLAELPADESETDEETPNPVAANPAQASRLDPFASYHPAYEERYQASQTQEIPVVRIPVQPTDSYRPQHEHQHHDQYAQQEQYAQREPYARQDQHAQQDQHTQREPYAQQEPYAQREPYTQQEPYAQREPYTQQDQGQGQGRRQQDQPFEFFAGAPRKQPYEPAPHIWPPHDEPHDDARRSR
ncbi:poly-gamma-glutamate synthase PgsB [Streptomyces sp. CS147]|uniref:poly-gamma-glutamate synthase PgsB n=1 Tax=Streptomyces sp. CS147 TaxID=2162715 RepID=UPI000D523847|nr:poly-gamma-glutamate synthase PgsB [Streptomyces sp. CS147]PVC95096.1 poly-gamma-glutamate synthase PgsB [Streptomyces sp. CS147]